MHLDKVPEDEELFFHLQLNEFPELADSFDDKMLLNHYHLKENKRFIGSPV